jgi:hypothetical protein
MTIIFNNDSDVIVYALEIIVSFARQNQYLLVVNYVWWLAGIIGLDFRLTIYIDNLDNRRQITQRQISTSPPDIARSVSVESEHLNRDIQRLRIMDQRPPSDLTKSSRLHPKEGIQKLSKNQKRKLDKEGVWKLSKYQRRKLAKKGKGQFRKLTK